MFEFLTADLGGLAKFAQVLAVVFLFFLFLRGLNVGKQCMYISLQLGLMLTDGFAPHEGVAIGIRLYFCTIYKVMLQGNVFFVRQKL
uniref:hypothetical protein n=1 Tax=Paenibacillus albidus TaxID=2041023 RepID=UPI001E40513E|nr:hypothetical protein [Paenibacillus albidus]